MKSKHMEFMTKEEFQNRIRRAIIQEYLKEVEKGLKKKNFPNLVPTLWDFLDQRGKRKEYSEYVRFCAQIGLIAFPKYKITVLNNVIYYRFDLSDTFKLAVYLANT